MSKNHVTSTINTAIKQLLYYVATYPNDGIVYRGSDMVLAAHYDVLFHNKSKSRIRAGDHKCLSENYPDPRWNVPVLTIAKIIKFVMTSVAEAELGALFISAKKISPIRQDLSRMGWPQTPSSLQTDNSTTEGTFNNTIVPQKNKSMDLCFCWICCRKAQDQLHYYWAPELINWGDYITKHHLPDYHERNHAIHSRTSH